METSSTALKKPKTSNFLAKVMKVKLKKSLEEEQKTIENARRTNLEKIIEILTSVKETLGKSSDLINKIDWAILKLQQGKLYEFEFEDSNNANGNILLNLLGFTENREAYYGPTSSNASAPFKNTVLGISEANSVDKQVSGRFQSSSPSKKTKEQLYNLTNLISDEQSKSRQGNSKLSTSQSKSKLKKKVTQKTSFNYNREDNLNKYFNKKANDFNLYSPNASSKSRILNRFVRVDVNPSNFKEGEYDFIQLHKFNIFDFAEKYGRQNVLSTIHLYSVKTLCPNYLRSLDMIKLRSFLSEIYNGYRKDVPYHNDLHGADLNQVLFSWIFNSNIITKIELKEIDLFCLFTSASIHDYKHPGTNNLFHINLSTDVAVNFNDISVLENYHLSESFKTMMKPENNFFEFASGEEYRFARKRIIDCILSTDMALHSKTILNIKTKTDLLKIRKGENVENIIQDRSNPKSVIDNQQEVLNLLIHTGDLSHNTKSSDISYKWTLLLYEEFFNQGDKERSLGKPISFLCDRYTTIICSSQVGFLKFIIQPSFEVLNNIIPEVESYFVENIKHNILFWEKKATELEKS